MHNTPVNARDVFFCGYSTPLTLALIGFLLFSFITLLSTLLSTSSTEIRSRAQGVYPSPTPDKLVNGDYCESDDGACLSNYCGKTYDSNPNHCMTKPVFTSKPSPSPTPACIQDHQPQYSGTCCSTHTYLKTINSIPTVVCGTEIPQQTCSPDCRLGCTSNSAGALVCVDYCRTSLTCFTNEICVPTATGGYCQMIPTDAPPACSNQELINCCIGDEIQNSISRQICAVQQGTVIGSSCSGDQNLWTCGNQCASIPTQQLFNATWQDGQAEWLYESQQDQSWPSCGGHRSVPRSSSLCSAGTAPNSCDLLHYMWCASTGSLTTRPCSEPFDSCLLSSEYAGMSVAHGICIDAANRCIDGSSYPDAACANTAAPLNRQIPTTPSTERTPTESVPSSNTQDYQPPDVVQNPLEDNPFLTNNQELPPLVFSSIASPSPVPQTPFTIASEAINTIFLRIGDVIRAFVNLFRANPI